MKFINYFNDFIITLNKYKIRYVTLRGYEDLPNNYSNDLDFGIHPDDDIVFFEALNEYKILHNVEIRLDISRLSVLKLKFIFQNMEIDFDFWFGFNYVGLEYINIFDVMSRAVPFKNFMIPCSSDELTISYLKELLHMRRLRKDKVDRLANKLNEIDSSKFAIIFSPKIKEKFIKTILNKEYSLNKLSLAAKIQLLKYHVVKSNCLIMINKVISFFYFRLFDKKNPLVIKFKSI